MHKIKFSRVITALLLILIILTVSYAILGRLFPKDYIETIEKYCNRFKVDTELVLALIKAESNFKEDAVSHANAKGLMQLTEETFEFCNESLKTGGGNIFNPEENIRAGVWYLSYLLQRYDGNMENAIASYNAGATNVDSWLKDFNYSDDGQTLKKIPFGETKRHIEKIASYKKIYEILY